MGSDGDQAHDNVVWVERFAVDDRPVLLEFLPYEIMDMVHRLLDVACDASGGQRRQRQRRRQVGDLGGGCDHNDAPLIIGRCIRSEGQHDLVRQHLLWDQKPLRAGIGAYGTLPVLFYDIEVGVALRAVLQVDMDGLGIDRR